MYMIVSSLFIKQVTVVKDEGEFCLVKFEGGGGARIRRSRLYETKEEAEQMLPHKVKKKHINPMGPYGYDH